MKIQTQLNRQVHVTNRSFDFFSEEELNKQIGFPQEQWLIALVKELIDNGLDASEAASIVPHIVIDVQQDSVSVINNGSSLPERVINNALNYMVRVSDKTYYVSPSRGQQGNGLKCLFAAGYVANGFGKVVIETDDKVHTIEITTNTIAQVPDVKHTVTKRKIEKNVKIILFYENAASLLRNENKTNFYKINIDDLVKAFALLNPHATFSFGDITYQAANIAWKKWIPTNPTSPHWYTEAQLKELIAAYIRLGKDISVREFVSEFSGLSGTAKQKKVTEETGLRGKLDSFVSNNDIDMEKVKQLLTAMKKISKPLKPIQLGIIGEAHMKESFIKNYGIAEKSFKYKKILGYDENNLPYSIEIAWGLYAKDREVKRRKVITGLNFSATLKVPVEVFTKMLQEMRFDYLDPVVIAFNMARPQFNFVDKGKTTIYV